MFRRRLMVAALGFVCAIHVAGSAATVTKRSEVTHRDPTRPPTGRVGKPAVQRTVKVPKLSSVLIGQTRRLAVIDGMVMAEGEERAGVRVWQIKSDRVVVSVAGRKPMTLTLDNARIHKEAR